MSLEADYAAAAREVLAEHLKSDGLPARIRGDRVETGIGDITFDFRVDKVEPSGSRIQMVFWAVIEGVTGVREPIQLDLLGHGDDAHEALSDGVHVLLDQVIPVLRQHEDPTSETPGLKVMTVTSLTDGRPTAWDLVAGPPGVGSNDRDRVLAAIEDQALAQGTIDSVVDVLAEVRTHWYKLFLARGDDGPVLGDMKVDGIAVGLMPTFDSPALPQVAFAIRQFGLVRPSGREPDAELLQSLGAEPDAPKRRRRWQIFGLLAIASIILLLSACSPVVDSSATPSGPAVGLDAASSGLCQAIAALPDQSAAEVAFTNLAHDHLHALAADPRLDRSLSAKVLEAMQAVEVDFSRPSDVAVLTSDLAVLRDTTDAALRAVGVEAPACTE